MKARLLVLLIALIVAGTVHAQEETNAAPLFMLVNGEDIWTYTPLGGISQITFSGYTDRPYMSPDGQRIAYNVVADIGIQALQRSAGLVSQQPSDIEIRDLVSGTPTRVATQPDGATVSPDVPPLDIIRSAPSWSPDSAKIAWTEDAAPGDVRRLVAYDIGSGQTQILTDELPLQAGLKQTLPLRWGAGGIALHSQTASETDPRNPQANVDTILIYNPDGTLRSSATPQPAEREYIYDFQWIDDGYVSKLGIIYSTGRWEVVDPATGAISPLVGAPELYSLTAPTGIALVFAVANMPNVGPVFTWTAGDTPLPYTGPLEWIGISPTGDAVAYTDNGEGYVWQDGTSEYIYGTDAYLRNVADVVWGPVGWRVTAR